jgi:hypothetical protein
MWAATGARQLETLAVAPCDRPWQGHHWETPRPLSAFNKFTQAEAEMFRKFTHLMFS